MPSPDPCPTCRNGPPGTCPRCGSRGAVFHEPPAKFLGKSLPSHRCVLCGHELEGPLSRAELIVMARR